MLSVAGGGPRVVAISAAFTPEFWVRFSVSAVWKKRKLLLSHPRLKLSIVGSLRDREVAFSASDRQGSNFESCVLEDGVILIISLFSGGSPGQV